MIATVSLLSITFSKVSENVIDWQFRRYVRSLGRDPDNLTLAEEKDLKSSMMEELYPGMSFSLGKCLKPVYINGCIALPGLDKSPKILVDTMLPTISPDNAARASVLVNGGYDECQYRVRKSKFLISH